jgi:DNA-directed RNA polymerase subunit E'/Rpb7|tara:strand:- start:8 stop:502 length:495 start_codon:yes stop_codon:yes gene_type:complete
MDNLFTKDTIKKSIAIEPKYINNKLEDYILKRLKDTFENKCLKYGYIKPNSIKIIKRSIGQVLASHFNGNILYNVEFIVEVCNPLEGQIIDIVVKNVNKMGILGDIPDEEDSPLNILLARQHHVENERFHNLKVGEVIQGKILGKRFEYGGSQISVIAILQDEE